MVINRKNLYPKHILSAVTDIQVLNKIRFDFTLYSKEISLKKMNPNIILMHMVFILVLFFSFNFLLMHNYYFLPNLTTTNILLAILNKQEEQLDRLYDTNIQIFIIHFN